MSKGKNNHKYMVTDHKSRVKMYKAGKNWVTSTLTSFGFIPNMTQIDKETVGEKESRKYTPKKQQLLQTAAAIGAVLAGSAATPVHAEENLPTQKELDDKDAALAEKDSTELKPATSESENFESTPASSEAPLLSEKEENLGEKSSLNDSLTLSESVSNSTSVSTSASLSATESLSASESVSSSESESALASSETELRSESIERSESVAPASPSIDESKSFALNASETVADEQVKDSFAPSVDRDVSQADSTSTFIRLNSQTQATAETAAGIQQAQHQATPAIDEKLTRKDEKAANAPKEEAEINLSAAEVQALQEHGYTADEITYFNQFLQELVTKDQNISRDDFMSRLLSLDYTSHTTDFAFYATETPLAADVQSTNIANLKAAAKEDLDASGIPAGPLASYKNQIDQASSAAEVQTILADAKAAYPNSKLDEPVKELTPQEQEEKARQLAAAKETAKAQAEDELNKQAATMDVNQKADPELVKAIQAKIDAADSIEQVNNILADVHSTDKDQIFIPKVETDGRQYFEDARTGKKYYLDPNWFEESVAGQGLTRWELEPGQKLRVINNMSEPLSPAQLNYKGTHEGANGESVIDMVYTFYSRSANTWERVNLWISDDLEKSIDWTKSYYVGKNNTHHHFTNGFTSQDKMMNLSLMEQGGLPTILRLNFI